MSKKNQNKKTKKQIVDKYEVDLLISGKKFHSDGTTLAEALNKLKPGKVAGAVVMTVAHGQLVKEKILAPRIANRFFSTAGLIHEINLKNIISLIGL